MVTEGGMRDKERPGRVTSAGRLPGAGDPSRRAFVLGGAAIGAAGLVGGHRVARLSVRERPPQSVAQAPKVLQAGTKAAVGATVSAGNPGGGSTRLEAAQFFDANVGRKMAMEVERAYWGPNKWDITTVQDLIENNIKIVASFTPSQTYSNTEATNLADALIGLNLANANVIAVCLFHEPNEGQFQSPDHYQTYIENYGPIVLRQGYELAYIPLINSNHNVGAYYPTATYNGHPMVTRMYGDFYCNSYDNGANLDEFFSVATSNNTARVGLSEFGKTLNVEQNPDELAFASYCDYLISEFLAWNSAGNNSADIIYFTNGPFNNPDTSNYISLGQLWANLSAFA
jgi:hypothetical protein